LNESLSATEHVIRNAGVKHLQCIIYDSFHPIMSIYKNPNSFADSEDSKLVADAKKIVPDPVLYNYTEVSKICLLSFEIP